MPEHLSATRQEQLPLAPRALCLANLKGHFGSVPCGIGIACTPGPMGKHRVTIARLLPILAGVSNGILTKITDVHYKAADVYFNQLPVQYQQLAREPTWRKSIIHSIRPGISEP
jgi:hypothetical protein